jgi:hypothetical protein
MGATEDLALTRQHAKALESLMHLLDRLGVPTSGDGSGLDAAYSALRSAGVRPTRRDACAAQRLRMARDAAVQEAVPQ